MKLINLQLCNFRQFYGTTPQIKFASGDRNWDSDNGDSPRTAKPHKGFSSTSDNEPSRNTTVIYGNNGAGKTSLLNAFTWVLYEKFTAAFAFPELLVNQRAMNEAQADRAVECWVELQFESDRHTYQLKRKCYAQKGDRQIQYSPTKLFMLVAGDDGRWYAPLEAPEDIIERILPASLHQYFFFDGERIDGFFRHNHNHSIAEDTKELLGVKILDRGIEHLKKAKRSLQLELQELGDIQTKRLVSQQIELEQKQSALSLRKSELVKRVEQLEQRKSNLAAQLLEVSGADKIQKLKSKLVEQVTATKKDLITSKSELKKSLSQNGYLVFLPDFSTQFLSLLKQLRDRGELAQGIKQEFIQQLLEQQRCMCGTDLKPEDDAYQNVKAWLKKAELKNVEEAAIRLETQVDKLPSQSADFWQRLDRQQGEIKQQYLTLNRLEVETERANKQLKNFPNRNIQQLQQQIEQIEAQLKTLILEQGTNQQQQSDLHLQLATVIQKIAQYKLTESKQKLAQKRINATEDAILRLSAVRTLLEQEFRLALEQKVQEIFSFISFTPYTPKLSDSYELTLVENTSGTETPVAASTGENQILSLSFIGGIIDRVRQWSQRNSLVGYDSSIFPIVMDSPFGSLDQIYRRQVAKAIPELANQLVILVTKTQWLGEVETQTRSQIDQEYVLTYYSPKPNCQPDYLRLNQQDYPLVQASPNNYEYTQIIPISSPGIDTIFDN